MTDDQLSFGERLRLRVALRERLRRKATPQLRVDRRPSGGIEYKSSRAGINARRLGEGLWEARRGGFSVRASSLESAVAALEESGA